MDPPCFLEYKLLGLIVLFPHTQLAYWSMDLLGCLWSYSLVPHTQLAYWSMDLLACLWSYCLVPTCVLEYRLPGHQQTDSQTPRLLASLLAVLHNMKVPHRKAAQTLIITPKISLNNHTGGTLSPGVRYAHTV